MKIREFETFRPVEQYLENALIQRKFSCYNGMVRVRRYRITVEEIEEPVEVLAERLQYLWDHSKNHHDTMPLRKEAEKIGYTLQGERGRNETV